MKSSELYYPISVVRVDDEDDIYYIAYLPDFGIMTCSCPGDTINEAIADLMIMKNDILLYMNEKGHELPEPSRVEL
jgi:hypothetical protein